MKLSKNELCEIRFALEKRLEKLNGRLVTLADQGEKVIKEVENAIRDCESVISKIETELKDTK